LTVGVLAAGWGLAAMGISLGTPRL
jgi:hypothetical protein